MLPTKAQSTTGALSYLLILTSRYLRLLNLVQVAHTYRRWAQAFGCHRMETVYRER
jgi:hypothetical protein